MKDGKIEKFRILEAEFNRDNRECKNAFDQ